VRRNAKISAGSDQNFLQPAHILHGPKRFPLAICGIETTQIKDRISNELSGTVEGYVSATIALEDLHAAFRESFGRGNHVGSFRVPSESDYWRVFKQQEHITDAAVFPKLD
jgi:hypothetical protein